MLEGTVLWENEYVSFARQASAFDNDPNPGTVKLEVYLDTDETKETATLEVNYNEFACVDFQITPATDYKGSSE